MLKQMVSIIRTQALLACHRASLIVDLARNLRRIKNGDLTSLVTTNLLGCQKLDYPHYALATRAMPERRFGGG